MIIALCILILIAYISCQTTVDIWKDGFFKFSYSVDEKVGTITFTMDAGTKGWLGMGFSPDGYMPGSDVIMSYIDSTGKPVVVDAFAKARTLPDLDTTLGSTDDLTNITGSYNNNRTVISCTRKLDTGDKYDIPIKKNDIIRMIFSVRETGNPSTEGSFLMHTKSKTLSLVLYQSSSGQATTAVDTAITTLNSETISLKYDKYPVPAKKTDYICKYFNVADTLKKQKNVSTLPKLHAIRFEAIIDTRAVHHILLFGCKKGTVAKPNYEECETTMNTNCTSIIGLSGPNSNDINMPPEAGFLWGMDETEVVYMQMHYENPMLSSNILDSSGFKVYFTEKLRTYNMGVTIFGVPMQFISLPPGKKDVVIQDTCPAACTKKTGINGVKIGFVALHGHTLLKKIRLDITKADGKVDNSTFRTDAFDFEVQYINVPKAPYSISPGDSLTTVCNYDTSTKTNVTFGGEATNNEMCFSFVGYYPKENGIDYCMAGMCYIDPSKTPVEFKNNSFINSLSYVLVFFVLLILN